MKKETLIQNLNNWGVNYRIISEDNNFFVVTSDFKPERWNLEIEKGIVTKIVFG